MTSSSSSPAAWFPPNLDSAGRRVGRGRSSSASEHADGEWVYPELSALSLVRSPARTNDGSAHGEEDESYERGYADGLRDGFEKAGEDVQPAVEALTKAAEALDKIKGEYTREAEGAIHALAIVVARKLIEREIAADPVIFKDLVERALKLLPLDAAIDMRLHPDDLDRLEGEFAKLASQGERSAIHCVADETLERGGFVLESPFRIVDGRVDLALRNLYERLQHE